MEKRVAIDLFSGAGGLTTGLKQAGFKVVAAVEVNPIAAETYKLNHKRTRLYRSDICFIDPKKIMNDLGLEVGQLDVLAGCPPCQGFSSHRTRNRSSSVIDVRNDLIFEFLKFVDVFKPKTVMLENVPGLARDERILRVVEQLSDLGYCIGENAVQVKDAAKYGVPQRRKRMIITVSRFGLIDEPPEVSRPETVRRTIGKLLPVGSSGDLLHDLKVTRSPKVQTMISLIPRDGGSRTDLPKEYWLPCHLRNPDGYLDVYGRMKWDCVSPTITGGCGSPSKGRFLHPEFDRGITLREAALLQTFPRGYKFSLARGRDYTALMIGNALPPKFIKSHALQVLKHLDLHSPK